MAELAYMAASNWDKLQETGGSMDLVESGPMTAVSNIGGLLYGWDMRRILFWWFIVIACACIAFIYNPNEASFRTYLNEQSFRKHLQGLNQETGSSNLLTGKDPSGTSLLDEAKLKSSGSGTISSTSSNVLTPTPFRFSNHIAVSLRTPQYHFLHSYLFSIVWILPGSTHSTSKRASMHKSTSSANASGGSSKPAATSFAVDGEDHGEEHDPTLQGVWYLGAFGRWWNMGRITDDPSVRPWSRKKKEALNAGDGGKREPGLIGIVALPKDDRSQDGKLASPTPLRRMSANHVRAESPPPLRPDASLPLHNRTPTDPFTARPSSSSHLTIPPIVEPHDASTKPLEVKDSPMLADLVASLSGAQSATAELRDQLDTLNSTVASSQAQLQAVVDDLRRKKKEEDSDRTDLKTKMKHLEENKRQAESAKREAEKKLKTAEGKRDAIRERIEKMRREIEEMKAEMDNCKESIAQSKNAMVAHDKAVMEESESRESELVTLDEELSTEISENADLATRVSQAAETLQALIDNSPQARTDYAYEGAGAHVADLPLYGSGQLGYGVNNQIRPYSASYSFPENYSGSGHPQHNQQTHHHALPNKAHDYRPFQSSNLFNNVNSTDIMRNSSPFRDISGYEGFGPMAASHGFSDRAEDTFLDAEDPGSPGVLMSSSFTANLLPQGLFRSLEGDQTPMDAKTELADPMDILALDSAALELPDSPYKSEEQAIETPTAGSPDVTTAAIAQHSQGSKESEDDPSALQMSLDEASRKLAQYDSEEEGPRPRRWFSGTKLNAHSGEAENMSASQRNSLFGLPLAQTISNESLLVPGGGFDNNPFAPSAAEKRALRWGSIGKWAGGVRQTSAPMGTGGPYNQHLNSLPASARSSSVDLNNNARTAWDQVSAPPISSVIGAVPQEKRSFKLWSLGKKSAKEEPGSGASIWN